MGTSESPARGAVAGGEAVERVMIGGAVIGDDVGRVQVDNYIGVIQICDLESGVGLDADSFHFHDGHFGGVRKKAVRAFIKTLRDGVCVVGIKKGHSFDGIRHFVSVLVELRPRMR